MGRVADLVMDALAAEVESRTGWDEPPALFFLYLEGGRCRASQLDLPEAYWDAAPPAQVLRALAEGMGEFSGLLQSVAPEGLHGAALRCEMWEVDAGRPGSARFAGARAAARARELSRHPDRVEVRSMWAVDRAGISYDATLARGASEARRSASYPKPGVPGYVGVIPEALDRLVTALLGVSLPARARW